MSFFARTLTSYSSGYRSDEAGKKREMDLLEQLALLLDAAPHKRIGAGEKVFQTGHGKSTADVGAALFTLHDACLTQDSEMF